MATLGRECLICRNVVETPCPSHSIECPRYREFVEGPQPVIGDLRANVPVWGITAEAGSGKSVVARVLEEEFGYTRKGFAKPLKAMMRAFYEEKGLTTSQIDERLEGSLKETDSSMMNGKSPRWAMQTLGTEWGRNCMGESFWTNAWLMSYSPSSPVVVDDVRFDNEAELIRSIGGRVIKLVASKRRRDAGDHSSEAGIDPSLIDFVIENDSTIEALEDQIRRLMAIHS